MGHRRSITVGSRLRGPHAYERLMLRREAVLVNEAANLWWRFHKVARCCMIVLAAVFGMFRSHTIDLVRHKLAFVVELSSK